MSRGRRVESDRELRGSHRRGQWWERYGQPQQGQVQAAERKREGEGERNHGRFKRGRGEESERTPREC